jgi:predicted cobalt transporter CbtA
VAARTDLPNAPSADGDAKSIPQVATELWELSTDYAKQETIDPLKGLGRFIAYGVAGALALGIGVILLLLAGLRALQTETNTTFTGTWSFAPYLIVVAAGLVLIALALWRITKRKGPGA